ncbi:E3 ubiquitin-protein ligase PRT1-like [Chenopodium quinoa]|nr:E3 ubiquitin-protein ligase PRT1-like [Chenopodium quinoa]
MANKFSNCFEIDHHDETISDSFICCVCLDLLYKPIVLECGHVSCFWCVHKSMDMVHESHCPICRNPYHYFPNICEMLHFLLLKMYPLAYKRRGKQILEEETARDCFSPQLDCKEDNSTDGSKPSQDANTMSDPASSSCITSIGEDSSKRDSNGSDDIKEKDLSAINKTTDRVSSCDVLCPACKELLYRPAVLNCGHVYCEACIIVPEDGIIICKVCEYPHPSDCPNVCLEFNNFLEELFPKEYAARKESVEEKKARFQHKNPSSCSNSKASAKKSFITPFRGSEDFIPWWNEHGSKVHAGAGCDYCGMCPIVGDRYRCLDCVELMGFDLCGNCYNTRSKRPGRFNQQHTLDHKFELVKQPDNLRNLMVRLVGGHLIDSSGAPVLAISAIENPPDGWIAVESVDDLVNPGNNAAAADESPGDMHDDTDTQDGSIEVEFVDALEVSDNNAASLSLRDHIIDQDGNEDPPF